MSSRIINTWLLVFQVPSDFRKTNADGRGYQPMLFDVKSSKVSQKNQIVTIQVTLKNELQRSFVYAFEKTG